MFERFTDRARRVLVLAQEEARMLNHNFIGTEHILLGLIHENEGVAAQALQALGVSLQAARARVEETIAPSGYSATGSPPFTPRAKKVLEYSLREALQLGHNYIGTEHILLGLVREGEGVAAQVLVSLGVELHAVRQQVIQMLAGYRAAGGSGPVAQVEVAGGPSGSYMGESRRGRAWRRAATVRPGQPGRRSRRQPEPELPGAVVSGVVHVTHSDGRLTGTAGGEPVDMTVTVPTGEGSAEGTFAGLEISAAWQLAANGVWHPDVPGALHGTCGGAAVSLLGWFHLEPDYLFDHGRIEGEIDKEPVAVYIEPADPYGDTGSFAADGYFADAGFSLRGAVNGHGMGRLEGSVGGRPVHLRVDRVDGASRTVTVTGTYEGPVALLLVCIGALLFFT